MTLEKLEERRNIMGKAWQPIDRVEPPRPPRLHRIRGQRGVLVHVDIPDMSLNLKDPLLRLTGIHPRQTGGPLFCQIITDFARGGRRANSTPGPARGRKKMDYHISISKTKALVRGVVTVQLIFPFDFAYTKREFLTESLIRSKSFRLTEISLFP